MDRTGLGSTSLTTGEGGGIVARQLYHPFGTVRWSAGTLPTDFGFTGQRDVPGIGLIFMHARHYHPKTGARVRSAHADIEATQLVTAEIFSGICGFTSTVQARMEGSRCVISEVLPRRAALGASERFQDDLGPLRQEVGADTDQSKTTGDHHVPIRHGKVGPVARRTH